MIRRFTNKFTHLFDLSLFLVWMFDLIMFGHYQFDDYLTWLHLIYLNKNKNIHWIGLFKAYDDKPVAVLTLLSLLLWLLIGHVFTGFVCLARTNVEVVLSSGFVCRGGTGGVGGSFVEFGFNSVSINIHWANISLMNSIFLR